jgi:hypothetical protein
MFPHNEVALLARTTLVAMACAKQGRPLDGYACLADGLCHARNVQDLGADWAACWCSATSC